MGLTARVVAMTLGLAALWACREAPAARGVDQPSALVGAWRSHVRASSGVLAAIRDLEFMTVFNVGGTMTESSNYDGAPPVPPAYGVWRRTADRTFEARYAFWITKPPSAFDELSKGGGWGPSGHGVLTETITTAEDRQSYTSKLVYVFYDASGKPAPGGGSATCDAVRMGF